MEKNLYTPDVYCLRCSQKLSKTLRLRVSAVENSYFVFGTPPICVSNPPSTVQTAPVTNDELS